jgi:hypothetical protein
MRKNRFAVLSDGVDDEVGLEFRLLLLSAVPLRTVRRLRFRTTGFRRTDGAASRDADRPGVDFTNQFRP